MVKRYLHILLCLAALLVLGGSKAQAQDTMRVDDSTGFCTSLHQVIASSKKSFADLRSDVKVEKNDFYGKRVRYNVVTGFPDALCTYVNYDLSHTFQTVLDSQLVCTDTLRSRFLGVANRLKKCLGDNYQYTQLDDLSKDELMFQAQADDLYDPNVVVRLAEENKKYVLTLEVVEPFFKRKE